MSPTRFLPVSQFALREPLLLLCLLATTRQRTAVISLCRSRAGGACFLSSLFFFSLSFTRTRAHLSTPRYGQENTTAISARATASELKAALEALRAISSVEVTFSNAAETYVCHNGTVGHNIVQIRFNDFEYYYKGYYGELSVRNASVPDLPNLIAHNTSNLVNTTWTIDGPTETLANYPGNLYLAADGAALPANTSAGNFSVMATSVAGTRQYLECSGKGTCDHTTGLCVCQYGYASSNGIDGSRGNVANCGHIVLHNK